MRYRAEGGAPALGDDRSIHDPDAVSYACRSFMGTPAKNHQYTHVVSFSRRMFQIPFKFAFFCTSTATVTQTTQNRSDRRGRPWYRRRTLRRHTACQQKHQIPFSLEEKVSCRFLATKDRSMCSTRCCTHANPAPAQRNLSKKSWISISPHVLPNSAPKQDSQASIMAKSSTCCAADLCTE